MLDILICSDLLALGLKLCLWVMMKDSQCVSLLYSKAFASSVRHLYQSSDTNVLEYFGSQTRIFWNMAGVWTARRSVLGREKCGMGSGRFWIQDLKSALVICVAGSIDQASATIKGS
jgi:hypothetical protein